MQKKEYSFAIGGVTLTAQFSDLADQTSGSVTLISGNTVVLATAVMSSSTREGFDYFPLTVDYEERFYAAGQILGSRFIRREARPSDEAVLSGRVIDRTIRPLFEHRLRNDVQVVATVLSVGTHDPDILAINAASLALAVSDIPWAGPVGAVRILKRAGEDRFIINPTYAERAEAGVELEMIVCGKDGNINMIEAGGREVGEDVIETALRTGAVEIGRLEKFQKDIAAEIGKQKLAVGHRELSESARDLFAKEIESFLDGAVFSGAGKEKIHDLSDRWFETLAARVPDEQKALAKDYFDEAVNRVLHEGALAGGRRADGRSLAEVRPLFAQAGGISETLHGSGIFYRGGTHVVSIATLGGPQDAQIIDGMEIQTKKHFMHHYNFPPFSSGETGRMGVNRRMIGHGALVEKAISFVLPPRETFPYTIRIVSESMASNGSTSMASVCGSTLALMDAGVPILAPVAGIAMGLMMGENGSYKILTDIQGPEDHHGDMDFKVAGTAQGVTAIQLDVKVEGVPIPVLREALGQAREARLQILGVIMKAISAPRPDISPSAPKIVSLKIRPDQIGGVIGPAGKTINKIREETGVEEVDIEDDGTVYITGKNGTAERARDIIESITHEYKAGERFVGEVTRILEFGAFVKIGRTAEGLVHISEIAPFRVERVRDLLTEGERVPVIIKEIDEKNRINLSIKQAEPHFAEAKKRKTKQS